MSEPKWIETNVTQGTRLIVAAINQHPTTLEHRIEEILLNVYKTGKIHMNVTYNPDEE